MAELNDYSPTAASNNSASPAGWPEGMAPSGLNDSDRELAARIARERDDTQGVTASGGSSNAYTFAAARDTTAAYTGEMFVFRANHTNTGAATINVTPSGGSARGAVAIQRDGAALSSGEIQSGGVYAVIYDGTQYQLLGASLSAFRGWSLIETQTASASSSLDFATGINSTFDLFALVVTGFVPATDGVQLHLRFSDDAGATYEADASDYLWQSGHITGGVFSASESTGAAQIQVTQATTGSAATEGVDVTILIQDAANSSRFTSVSWTGQNFNTVGALKHIVGSGAHNAAVATNGVQVLFSSGNIASGTASLYGIRRS